jgi:hypothetical protein
MTGIQNVSLVREQSSAAVYLIVGDTKFWITDGAEFDALGFDWSKVRVVADGSTSGFKQQLLHAAGATRPSDVFWDRTDGRSGIPAFCFWNTKLSAFIVRKDILVAGWLRGNPGGASFPDVAYKANGIEDIHYDIFLDAVFLDRMYGVDGLSKALVNAAWPGNPASPRPIPFAPVPPFVWWILPDKINELHGELNAWHARGTMGGDPYWGAWGPPPAGWVNPSANWASPLPRDADAWFPFDPLDPQGTGRPLRGGTYDANESSLGDGGDYIVMRGTLWQENAHDVDAATATAWNQAPPVNHNGYGEMHPPDCIVRVGQPNLNARITTTNTSPIPPGVTGPPIAETVAIWPDFSPSSITRKLQVRTIQRNIDPVFTNSASIKVLQEQDQGDHVDVTWSIVPTGTQQARLKVSWLVGWREIDVADQVWVDDQIPPGATRFEGGDTWDWQGTNVFSETSAHQSAIWPGAHQHYFTGATNPMVVVDGDTLFAMVFLDPDNPPNEVMLQWLTATDWVRAYWGDNLIGWGADGTAERRYMGPLPLTGEWVRLEVPALSVGITTTANVNGMAFTLFNGRAIWDYSGVCKTSVYQ